MREDDLRESSNIDDRRGMSGVGKGGLGIGAVLVLTLIGWVTGINPATLIGGAEIVQQQMAPPQQAQQGRAGTPADQVGIFVAKVLGETEDVWSKQLPAETGKPYVAPVLVLYSGQTQSGCGGAQSAMGPFYCPTDCLAGAWANHMNQRHDNLTAADLQQAVNTATAIGDDRLSRAAGRAAVPDSFTHGSAAQRVRWLTSGFRGGKIAGCNTFQGPDL